MDGRSEPRCKKTAGTEIAAVPYNLISKAKNVQKWFSQTRLQSGILPGKRGQGRSVSSGTSSPRINLSNISAAHFPISLAG
jgi:hypothetical protein